MCGCSLARALATGTCRCHNYWNWANNNWAATWQNQQNHCAPSETPIRLGIHPVWSESSQCTQCVTIWIQAFYMRTAKTGQPELMPRLIWVFSWYTTPMLVFLPCHYKWTWDVRKPVFRGLRTTKVQISLCILTVWSAPLLFSFQKVAYLNLPQERFQLSS